MSATLTRRFLFARKAHAVLHYLHLDLMLAGLIAGIALTNVVSHRFELLASLQAALPSHSSFGCRISRHRCIGPGSPAGIDATNAVGARQRCASLSGIESGARTNFRDGTSGRTRAKYRSDATDCDHQCRVRLQSLFPKYCWRTGIDAGDPTLSPGQNSRMGRRATVS